MRKWSMLNRKYNRFRIVLISSEGSPHAGLYALYVWFRGTLCLALPFAAEKRCLLLELIHQEIELALHRTKCMERWTLTASASSLSETECAIILTPAVHIARWACHWSRSVEWLESSSLHQCSWHWGHARAAEVWRIRNNLVFGDQEALCLVCRINRR